MCKVTARVELKLKEVAMFDFIISTAAFKNFAAPVGVLREMYRVLKTNGKALIIDMRRYA